MEKRLAKTMNYRDYLKDQKKDVIAMIHVPALPGTPLNKLSPCEIRKQVIMEATLYKELGLKTVMIENMHDIPYTKTVGPEITSLMTLCAKDVKAIGLYCGIQILAGCNREALAAAHSANIDFIRAEGFVFGHLADEGMFDACAGELLRYRKNIGAENILVFTDIKKKHSSHALTADISLLETAKAAKFFLTDGVIVTGSSTGEAASAKELESLGNLDLLKLIGSGLTAENLKEYFKLADLFIVGSWLKHDGDWTNSPDPVRVKAFIEEFSRLQKDA
jgi:hypothetical protein